MIRIEDIVFWILILTSVAILLWLLRGSPTLENTVITVGLFILGSELMLWRKYFEVDKNTAVGFVKVKSDLDKINSKLENIEKLIKRK